MPSKMAALLLLLVAVTGGVWGQGREACPSLSDNDCYYDGDGVATLPSNEAQSTKMFSIGAFFNIHEMGANAYSCSDEAMRKEGILHLQAFLWAIKTYSARVVSPGITVGAVIFDECMRAEQNVESMLSYAQCKLYLQTLPQTTLVAYVGPYSNEAVSSISHLATDLSVPLLAPVANSPELMYVENEFLLKLTPSFDYDVDAIVAVLQELQADFVIVLYDSEDQLWTDAYTRLSAKLNSTCVTYQMAVTNDADELTDLVEQLEDRQDARYVVPLMSYDLLNSLLEAIKSDDEISANTLRFILTSDIGRDMEFMGIHSGKANNTLIVEHNAMTTFDGDVDTFANELALSADGQVGSADISWITDYYLLYPDDLPAIDDLTPSKLRYSIAKTLEAVYGIMEGMEAAIDHCDGITPFICDDYRSREDKGERLLTQISLATLNARQEDVQGNVARSSVSYTIYHYLVPKEIQYPARFDTVGTITWTDEETANVVMSSNLLDNEKYGTQFTDSTCSNDGECCLPSTTVPPSTSPAATSAMVESTTMDPNAADMVYVTYPRGQEITGAYMDLDRDSGDYGTRFDLNHKWIIALGVLAGLGIVSVFIFEIYILYKLLGTREGNKWRTMWLGQLLLFGVLLCYVTLFAYIPIPTQATCGITRFGVGVSYSICFAVLLVKLMVILTSRSTSDILLPGDVESPNYLKGVYQFLMFVFAVGVQVVIDVQWLITVPPEAVQVISNNNESVWVCNHYTWEAGKAMDRMDGWVRTNFENHVLSLSYIMVMILITTILSLNAHGIITNHRESVFIGIAAGFSIPIWLAWGLVGGLNDDHDYAQEFGDACIAFGLFCTATLILFAMFLPKVRQLVNMGVEGIYLEDDRDTYYAGSVIMAPSSYKSKGPNSVIYVNNQGIYSEPVVIGNGTGDLSATHLRHPGSTYSAPPAFVKKADSTYGGSRVLRVTDDLKGRHPQKPKTQSEIGYPATVRPRSQRGTMPRSRSHTNLGAL